MPYHRQRICSSFNVIQTFCLAVQAQSKGLCRWAYRTDKPTLYLCRSQQHQSEIISAIGYPVGMWRRGKRKAVFNYFSPNTASLAIEQKPRELRNDFLVQAKSYPAFSVPLKSWGILKIIFQAFLVQRLFPPLRESWLFRHHLQFFLSSFPWAPFPPSLYLLMGPHNDRFSTVP